MTVVRPNSIAGINSITVQTGQALNIHDASGNLIRSLTYSSGISPFASINVTQGTGDLTVGVSTFFVDNSATNVGVGTNVPYNNAGTNVHIHSANTTSEIRFTNSSTGGGNNGGTIQQGGTTLYVSNSESGNIVFENNGSERLRIQSTGQILYSAASGDNQITSKRTNAAGSNGNYFFHLAATNNSDNAVGGLGFHRDTATDDSRFVLFTRNTGGSNQERLRITSAGLVGIGTATPSVALDLVRSKVANSDRNTDDAITIENNGTTNINIISATNNAGFILFSDDERAKGYMKYTHGDNILSFKTNGTEKLVIGSGGDLTLTGDEGVSANLYLIADQGDDNGDGWRIGSNQDDNDLTIANNDSGSYVDIVRLIHKVGNTGTNMLVWGQGVTDNNEAMLTVKGTTTGGTDRHSQLLGAKHSGLTNLASAMRWQSDDGTTRYLYMDNSVTVRLSGNYTDIGTTSGTVIGSQSSDIRLKNLIGDGSVPYGLSEINQLNPIKFKYKKTGGDPDRIQIGFSAQQVKPIIPEAVYDTGEEVEGEENILGMDYVNIIPALVNSIKELTAEVESLKTEVAALKSS